jgi:hypothetical protein
MPGALHVIGEFARRGTLQALLADMVSAALHRAYPFPAATLDETHTEEPACWVSILDVRALTRGVASLRRGNLRLIPPPTWRWRLVDWKSQANKCQAFICCAR